MIVNIPMMLIYLGLDVYLGIRLGDGFYFAVLGGVVQYFILGFLWDKLTDWIQTIINIILNGRPPPGKNWLKQSGNNKIQ